MNCCENCFRDIELKSFISSNSNEIANCDFCKTKNTSVIDATELQDQFTNLLDIYAICETGKSIDLVIQENWNIFKIEESKIIIDLLKSIVTGLDEDYISLINSPVKNSILIEADELIEDWKSFKKVIRDSNRFLIKNKIDLEVIEDILPPRDYTKGKIFYRSRICNDKNGFPIDKMGKPCKKLAKAGRANPKGIPYLYVAQSIETTFYEARATFLDYIAIGKFKLLDNVRVIALRIDHKESPFRDGLSIEKYIKGKPFLDLLENELSKPLRRQDDELDYLPTQYLCEYIKTLGYDGVEYGSSLYDGGINIVFFDDSKLECTESKVYEVSSIKIESNEVK